MERLTSWLVKLIVLFSTVLILHGICGMDGFGAVLVAIPAVVWAALSYVERSWGGGIWT